MKVHTTYECEVCGSIYDRIELAYNCEATVAPAPPTDIEIGSHYYERSYLVRGNKSGKAIEIRLRSMRQNSFAQTANDPVGHQWEIGFDRPLKDIDHYCDRDNDERLYFSMPEHLIKDEEVDQDD